MDADESRFRCFARSRSQCRTERADVKRVMQALGSRHVVAVSLLLLAAGATSRLPQRATSTGVTAATQRGEARELAFTLLDGHAWRLSEQRGHVVAVNLWATWCAPCRSETPALVQTVADLGPQGFAVLGISLDTASNRAAQVSAFRTAYRIEYPMAFPDPMSQIASGLDSIPTTLLFDREGRTAKIYVGELDDRGFRADVKALLAEPLPSEGAVKPARSER